MIKKFLQVGIFLVVFIAVQSSQANEDNLILFKTKTIDTSQEPIKIKTASHLLSDKKIYLVVQFHQSLKGNHKKEIQNLGGEFLQYIPNKAFIVRISEKASAALYHIKAIRWIGDYSAQFKIDPGLSTQKIRDDQKINLHIQFFSGEEMDSAIKIVKQYQGVILYQKKEFLKVSIIGKSLRSLMDAFANSEGVEWIEEAKKPILLDIKSGEEFDPYADLTGYETGVKILKAQMAYSKGLSGEGQIVAIADTGLDVGAENEMSEDFKGRIVKAYTLGFFAETWADKVGHGTHVAGSILGAGIYSRGLLRGVAYQARAVIQGLWGAFDDLSIPVDLEDLFTPSYEDGARIHSNSWGHPSFSYDQYARSLDKFMWEHPDMMIVMAVGNEGKDANQDGVVDSHSLLSPSNAKNCLTVGASENYVLKGGVQKMWKKTRAGDNWKAEPIASDFISDNPNGIAAFSSRGPTADGRIKPDIMAPGTNILSAKSHHPKADNLSGAFNEHYVWANGTSMAAPLAAGAAAVVRQFLAMHGRNPSAALVKAALLNGAEDLYPGQFGFSPIKEIPTPRPNVHEGWGRVNIEQTLFPSDRRIQYIESGVTEKTVYESKFEVKKSSEPIRVTLAYTDYPAALSAKKALVNDLDLEIMDPKNKRYTSMTSQGGPDRINNVEGVDIHQPIQGTYVVRVIGYEIPQGKDGAQPFALVISGGI